MGNISRSVVIVFLSLAVSCLPLPSVAQSNANKDNNNILLDLTMGLFSLIVASYRFDEAEAARQAIRFESYLPLELGEVELVQISGEVFCAAAIFQTRPGQLAQLDLEKLSTATRSRTTRPFYRGNDGFVPVYTDELQEYEPWSAGPVSDEISYGLTLKSRTIGAMGCGDHVPPRAPNNRDYLSASEIFYTYDSSKEIMLILIPSRNYIVIYNQE